MNTTTKSTTTTTRRLLTLLLAAAMALPLLAPPANAEGATDDVKDLVIANDTGSGALAPATNIDCCGSLGLRFVAANATFNYNRLSNGNYTVQVVCNGAAGHDAAAIDITCSVNSTNTNITFPGGAGVVPHIANNVAEPFKICATAVASYVLQTADLSATTCAKVDLSTGRIVQIPPDVA